MRLASGPGVLLPSCVSLGKLVNLSVIGSLTRHDKGRIKTETKNPESLSLSSYSPFLLLGWV
jgi:hypothetical protein